MPFSNDIKTKAMLSCGRRCCICHKFCGNKMEVHHIKAQADGGTDSFDNAIPLCFDCHADVRHYNPRHPKGIKFTEKELIVHRDSWYKVISNGNETPTANDASEVKLKCSVKEQLEFLQRIKTGQEMLAFVSGACAIKYSYDEVNDASEAEYIGGIIQHIQDFIDLYDVFEPIEYVKSAFELNSAIQKLEEQGFWLYMGTEKRILTGGVKREPVDFPVLYLSVKRISLIDKIR